MENDKLEIPEEYLNMSVEELREKKEELLLKRIVKELSEGFEQIDKIESIPRRKVHFNFDKIPNMFMNEYCDKLRELCAIQDSVNLSELNFLCEQESPHKPNAISSLKKRIKYCKSPLEKRDLEQQLNKLYKERKKHD